MSQQAARHGHRKANQVSAKAVDNTNKITLQRFMVRRVRGKASTNTGDATTCTGLAFDPKAANHPVRKFVGGIARSNGIGIFSSMRKRHFCAEMTE